jgi:hypothetical protein
MVADEVIEFDPHNREFLEKVGRLRVLAWSSVLPELNSQMDCWLDEFEVAARHWCILRDGQPVAAARISFHQVLEDVPDAPVYAGLGLALTSPIASFKAKPAVGFLLCRLPVVSPKLAILTC